MSNINTALLTPFPANILRIIKLDKLPVMGPDPIPHHCGVWTQLWNGTATLNILPVSVICPQQESRVTAIETQLLNKQFS